MRVERALVAVVCIMAVTAGGCGGRLAYNLPPSSRLMEPGPGVGGPGPGVIPPAGSPYGIYGGAVGRYGDGMGSSMGGPTGAPCEAYDSAATSGSGVAQASYCDADAEGGCPCDAGEGYAGCPHGGAYAFSRPDSMEAYADAGMMAGLATSQIAFLGDEGVQVSWDVAGYGMFDSVPLVIPGRQDFYQGAIYRLRLTNIPGRPGVELYPTLEVAPVTPRTDAFLAHSPIPVQFTEEDFDQVNSGNFVTKVIYLPDPEFQELALAGVETLVSTRLDPGVDPIAEADRRGSILAIVRMGNKDLRRGAPAELQAEEVVPASHNTSAKGSAQRSNASHALYKEQLDELGKPAPGDGVVPAQYCGPYGDGATADLPMGMPTSGFAPPAVPPNMIAGAPQWGLPITGTPIGLPGPPHVPLGVPAGLQKHVMKNRTRVLLPPPVAKVKLSVKQRPGLNYPKPVNHVHVNETQREPLLLPGWLTGMFGRRHGAGMYGGHQAADCPPY
jgi:hypothetical protein